MGMFQGQIAKGTDSAQRYSHMLCTNIDDWRDDMRTEWGHNINVLEGGNHPQPHY